MIVLWYIILGFLATVLMVTLFNALTAPMLKNGIQPTKHPLVSILIPARDESANIEGCLESLIKQNYKNIEIIVLDDESTDNTMDIIQKFSESHNHVKCLSGKSLPDGWTGKNWACHQLSKNAKGDILIFSDADNRYATTAVSKTVGWMERLKLDLFSAFPQQNTHTWAEKLIIPSVYMTVYCYLPLWLTYWLPTRSLAAANGQWIAFTKKAYKELGGHESAKSQIVEDTWFARYAKSKKMKTITTAGTGEVFGRMYRNWSEIWQGFSKNLFGLMDYQLIPFLLLLLLMFAGYVAPYFLLFYPPLLLYAISAILMNIIIRIILTLKYKDPFLSIVLHPIAIGLTILISINSIRSFYKSGLEWKGRKIFGNHS